MSNRPKIKSSFRGTIECKGGEEYIFKNGIDKVPGVRRKGKPVRITLAEFKQHNISLEEFENGS